MTKNKSKFNSKELRESETWLFARGSERGATIRQPFLSKNSWVWNRCSSVDSTGIPLLSACLPLAPPLLQYMNSSTFESVLSLLDSYTFCLCLRRGCLSSIFSCRRTSFRLEFSRQFKTRFSQCCLCSVSSLFSLPTETLGNNHCRWVELSCCLLIQLKVFFLWIFESPISSSLWFPPLMKFAVEFCCPKSLIKPRDTLCALTPSTSFVNLFSCWLLSSLSNQVILHLLSDPVVTW